MSYPSVKLTKKQFYTQLSRQFEEDSKNFNPLYDDCDLMIIEIRPCDTITKWLQNWIEMFNTLNHKLNLNVYIKRIKCDFYMLGYETTTIDWPETDNDESVEFEYEYQNDFVVDATA